MSAFPMVSRCALFQWRGLSESERVTLNALWGASHPFSPSLLHGKSVSQLTTPLWTVSKARGDSLDLISMKSDYLGDVP